MNLRSTDVLAIMMLLKGSNPVVILRLFLLLYMKNQN